MDTLRKVCKPIVEKNWVDEGDRKLGSKQGLCGAKRWCKVGGGRGIYVCAGTFVV